MFYTEKTEGVVDARLDFITHNVSCVNDATDESQRVPKGARCLHMNLKRNNMSETRFSDVF